VFDAGDIVAFFDAVAVLLAGTGGVAFTGLAGTAAAAFFGAGFAGAAFFG
jgi:hypothetical protein